MIKAIQESRRGCGYRKPGGLYMFCGRPSSPCGKLPIPLHVCPTCGNGIKQTRSFQWIKRELLKPGPCVGFIPDEFSCIGCPLAADRDPNEKLGLMWVGEKYYPTPGDFMKEAREQGVSKRIPAVPKDFVLGKTWLALAHRKGFPGSMFFDPENPLIPPSPAVFALYRPTEIQYVVKGDETEEDLERMEKRGITPVKVQYDEPIEVIG